MATKLEDRTVNAKAFGEAVRKKRLALGMTQVELAERIRIFQSDLSKIELGLRVPEVQTLKAIEDALGIPRGKLYSML